MKLFWPSLFGFLFAVIVLAVSVNPDLLGPIMAIFAALLTVATWGVSPTSGMIHFALLVIVFAYVDVRVDGSYALQQINPNTSTVFHDPNQQVQCPPASDSGLFYWNCM